MQHSRVFQPLGWLLVCVSIRTYMCEFNMCVSYMYVCVCVCVRLVKQCAVFKVSWLTSSTCHFPNTSNSWLCTFFSVQSIYLLLAGQSCCVVQHLHPISQYPPFLLVSWNYPPFRLEWKFISLAIIHDVIR